MFDSSATARSRRLRPAYIVPGARVTKVTAAMSVRALMRPLACLALLGAVSWATPARAWGQPARPAPEISPAEPAPAADALPGPDAPMPPAEQPAPPPPPPEVTAPPETAPAPAPAPAP